MTWLINIYVCARFNRFSSFVIRSLKSTFGVHYSTGSPGQLGLRVGDFPGSLGRWVTKCDPVPCLMSTSESWFTFNHARICSDLSIRLRLLTVSIPQTVNNLSTNACDDGAETKSCAINVRTGYMCDFWFSCQISMALPPNERVWMSAMYWFMRLRFRLITGAVEVASPWLGSSCSY